VIPEYIRAALEHARYGIIEDAKPYYGEVPGLPRVFAAGRTLEDLPASSTNGSSYGSGPHRG